MTTNLIPESGFLRFSQIVGDKKAGIPPIVPVDRFAWWLGVKHGRYPAPVKLSPGVTCWRADDIQRLIAAAQ